ncbi:RNA polymerase sigma factor SigV [bioreactor metagenome]|uniref:RNA polymerase sigma factor SigV n=1 Tax=bioreactor metagenome TaxID=1076179 RepID=A0A645EKU5_9ZZZZ|nr:RNA polymerase sigma factor [Candidatus Metalachnospira sp.]
MGNRKLVENFVKDNIGNAYRFAFTYMKNQQDAEDVVSESIVKALKSADNVKDMSRLKPWFFKIVSNTALNSIKKNMKIIPFENLDDKNSYSDIYNISNLMELIEQLPKDYLEVITLRYFEDLRIKDIAEVLSINENTIKTRLYKALKILKEDVEDKYEGF